MRIPPQRDFTEETRHEYRAIHHRRDTGFLLVLDVTIGGALALLATAPVVLGLAGLWFVWPLRTR